MIRYHLSARQAKELRGRGAEIKIAIPTPPVDPPDWHAWIASVLADVSPGEIVRVHEPEELRVAPTPGADGMAGILGAIVNIGQTPAWTIGVSAVVVHLRSGARAGHKPPKAQWPGSVEVDGRRIPHEE